MKLPLPSRDINRDLREFDVWITPALGEIRDTTRFKQELDRVVTVLETMGAATGDFAREDACNPLTLAATFVEAIQRLSADAPLRAGELLHALATVLFLVTGKSDNNAKCQLPIYLRDNAAALPPVPGINAVLGRQTQAPRVLRADTYMKIAAAASIDLQRKLLEVFIGFILSDAASVAQLWSIGRSYFLLKPFNRQRELLSPLVVFQVRGPVAATGGHQPEVRMRLRLAEWGLAAGRDYNTTDVVLPDLLGVPASPDVRSKTRAYDFIIPYRTPHWQPRLFIQSQFYAGDAGSVSHKNLDQTTTSRRAVQDFVPQAHFVEYVDGAGYFSSLNGDLKKLLEMASTATFVQIRSIPIRLRRSLQQVGFLTPLEVEHAILCTDGTRHAAITHLVAEGYASGEIERCIEDCIARDLLHLTSDGPLALQSERRVIARRYLLLDVVARNGTAPTSDAGRLSGMLLVPGYGPFWGMKLDQLAMTARILAPALLTDWALPETILGDVQWLSEQGMAVL